MQQIFHQYQPVIQFIEHCLALFGAYKALEIIIPWARDYARRNWHTLAIALCLTLIAYAVVNGDAWGRGYNYDYANPHNVGGDGAEPLSERSQALIKQYVRKAYSASDRRIVTASPAPETDQAETSRRDTTSDIDYEIRALEILLGAYDKPKPKTVRPSESVRLGDLRTESGTDTEAITPEPVPLAVSPTPNTDTIRHRLTVWKNILFYTLCLITLIAVVSVALCLGLLAGPDLCHMAWDRLREFCQQIPTTMPMPEHWLPRGVVRSVSVSMISLPIVHGICWALDMDSGFIVSTGMGMVGAGVYALTGEVPR